MALGNGFERFGQVAERFDAVEFAGFDQRRGAGPGMRAFIMTGEQMVLAAEGQRTDAVLNRVAVHLDMAVREEHLQPAPAVGDVGEMLTQPGLGRDACAFLLEPVAERSHQRRGAGLADKPARFRIKAADFCFDGVERCDLFEAWDCPKFCARGLFSLSDHEPVTEDDSELGLRLEPFTRGPFPFLGSVIEDQV